MKVKTIERNFSEVEQRLSEVKEELKATPSERLRTLHCVIKEVTYHIYTSIGLTDLLMIMCCILRLNARYKICKQTKSPLKVEQRMRKNPGQPRWESVFSNFYVRCLLVNTTSVWFPFWCSFVLQLVGRREVTTGGLQVQNEGHQRKDQEMGEATGWVRLFCEALESIIFATQYTSISLNLSHTLGAASWNLTSDAMIPSFKNF